MIPDQGPKIPRAKQPKSKTKQKQNCSKSNKEFFFFNGPLKKKKKVKKLLDEIILHVCSICASTSQAPQEKVIVCLKIQKNFHHSTIFINVFLFSKVV